MTKFVLHVGEYQGADFDELLAAALAIISALERDTRLRTGNHRLSTLAAAGAKSAPSRSTTVRAARCGKGN